MNARTYVLGQHKLTQSNAILRYIARKHDLVGKTEDERVRVDIMAEQSMDFRNGLVRLCYNPAFVRIWKLGYFLLLRGRQLLTLIRIN